MDSFDFIGVSAEALDFLRRAPGDVAMKVALECGDPDKLADRLIRRGDVPDDARALAAEVRRIQEDVKHFPGIELGHILRESAANALAPIEAIGHADDFSEGPGFDSDLGAFDEETGGLQGVTVLGGKAGAAKSMLAQRVSVRAAFDRLESGLFQRGDDLAPPARARMARLGQEKRRDRGKGASAAPREPHGNAADLIQKARTR